MAKFRVMAPDLDDPTLTGCPVEVSEHQSAEKAIEVACDIAKSLEEMGVVVLVEEVGTNNVWSCQYHPELPIDTKQRDKKGYPVFEFDPEFRVVFDGTEVPTEEVEINDDPEDHTTMIQSVGTAVQGEHTVTDYTSDNKAVDRSDLLPA